MHRPTPSIVGANLFSKAATQSWGNWWFLTENPKKKIAATRWAEALRDFQDRRDLR